MKEELNILEDVQWIKTTDGFKTPKEIFLNGDTVQLDKAVPGFVYGAQYRFLMTIFPLLAKIEPENIGKQFSTEAINKVFDDLSQYSDLFSETNPFLQVSENILTESDGHIPVVDLSKKITESKLPGKLYPTGQTPASNQVIFWNFEQMNKSFLIEETVLALVVYYFYGVGTNTCLTNKNGKANKETKLSNGSSALRYLNSVEILPQGETLMESLALSTPKDFTQYYGEELLPHWADRSGEKTSIEDPLWRFSWSSNTVKTYFNEEHTQLLAIERGGNPEKWREVIPKRDKEWHGKSYHDSRSEKDPLYFYRLVKQTQSNKEPENKLWRYSLSTDPYYMVTQWHSEALSIELDNKINNSLAGDIYLDNFVFLEHGTEGASNSFNIRHSKVLTGWKDELIVDEEKNEFLQALAINILDMKNRLTGLFREKTGKCQHLSQRRADVENLYWGEVQEIFINYLNDEIKLEDTTEKIKQAAISAFEGVSSNRNSVHINAHIKCLNILKSWKG